jgi:ABC-2 type transport system ATP-binding protein
MGPAENAVLVQTEALTKRYGTRTALREVSLQVPRGEVLGLLGPNGAGKTTLLRVLTGYLRPSSGRASIDRLDCYRQSLEVRRRLAYLPGDARLFRRLTGNQTIDLLSRLRRPQPASRARQLASRLDLDLSRRVGQMSTGMRQQLALVITLAPEVPLVILDEPTANLDPSVRREVLRMVREAGDAGRTVLFSSHVLAEVEEACDRVAVMGSGQLAETVHMDDVRNQHVIRTRLDGPLGPIPAGLQERIKIGRAHADEAVLYTEGNLAPLLGWLASQPIRELHVEPTGLSRLYEKHHPPRDAPLVSL